MLTLAVAKGRLLEEALPLLKKADIVPLEDPFSSRQLSIPTTDPNLRLLLVRSWDVPTYVSYGAADMGVVGKDVLLEKALGNIYEPLDLKISRCRLVLAGKEAFLQSTKRLKIATKYARVTQQFFAKKGLQADIIPLYGSIELAPLLGLSDYIIDLVDTGNTLKSNGLSLLEEIVESTARLIVNKAAMKMCYPAIQDLIQKLKSIV